MLAVFDYLGQDAAFTLNQLAALNTADPNQILTGRLDLQHVGILGTSLGGITAAEACRLDQRFRACLMVDVAMPPDVVEQETTVQAVFASLPGDGDLVLIPGMFHADITDLPYIIAWPLDIWLGTSGPTDWRRSHAIINAYSLAFFDKYFKGQPAPLLNGPSPQFAEVRLELRQ